MDSITQQYVQELQEIKAMLKLTDRELAQEIGVTPAMLSNWRTGKAGISARCQDRVLQFYLRIDWKTVERENPGAFSAPPALPQGDRLLEYVTEEWQNLTPSERGEVIAVIEQIKERKNTVADIHSAAE
jgi:transcriptional regulator with XRE-family HTH domain